MAEVISKKSSNVVSNNSNKKNNGVCSVQSNNGLIKLDNITTSNNELIKTLCDETEDDDDLITTRNTRNEISAEEKSLQEMIESEFAMRINSSNDIESLVAAEGNDEDLTSNQPELTIKKIIIEPRQEPPVDINAEFIGAEIEHYTIVGDPYTYKNGHESPEFRASRFPERPEIAEDRLSETIEKFDNDFVDPVCIEDVVSDQNSKKPSIDCDTDAHTHSCNDFPDDDVLEDEIIVKSAREADWQRSTSFEPHENPVCENLLCLDDDSKGETIGQISVPEANTMQREEHEVIPKDHEEGKVADVWPDPVPINETNPHQVGQFSDDFDVMRDHLGKNPVELEEREEGQHSGCENDLNIDGFSVTLSEGPLVNPSIDSNGKADTNTTLESDQDLLKENVEDAASAHEGPNETPGYQGQIIDLQECQSDNSFDQIAGLNEKKPHEVIAETEITLLGNDEQAEYHDEVGVQVNETTRSIEQCFLEEEIEKEEESSWITVEEATNDRNKTARTSDSQEIVDLAAPEVDKRDREEWKIDVSTDDNSFSMVKPANGLEPFDQDPETNFIPDDISLSSCNQTETPTSFLLSKNGTDVAPLATPDDESSEFSSVCDTESREEVITTNSVVVTSSSVKSSTKTKKKKIEGVTGNDASATLTPRTKKTKKSKKNDLEKENISVNINSEDPSMHTCSRQISQELDISEACDLSNVNVKSLTQSYVSEANRGEQEKPTNKEVIETGVSIKQLCRSFGDISSMTDVDQPAFGISEQSTGIQEKAKSMDDLRLWKRDFAKLANEATVFVGVSVKALRASYCSLANLTNGLDGDDDEDHEIDGDLVNHQKIEKSSFNKFDALSKKSVLHVRSSDSTKAQQQLNSVSQNGDANPNCRSCGKVVFQMEQTKAEGLVWHKNCFRCVQCSKQLNVDSYQSHESTLYCKAHFKELFQPKPVEESDQPASDKPDLGLEELSSLNVKSRFQVFEKTNETINEIERSPSQIVKRSPSILSKLAKFQAKGMDIGVADDSLNGIPFEESSESEEDEEIEESEDMDNDIIKAKRVTRERPMSFTKMDDIKNRWECTSQQGRRESQREARKEEIAGIRSRLFMGKQGKMKEMYQQAVAESERVTKTNPTEEIQHSTHARSIKERFERGEPIATSDGENEAKLKQEKPDEEIAAGISKKSRSLFLELDASAAKTGRPVTPVNPKTPTDVSRRARDAFMGRQVSDDVIRSTDTTAEVQVETSDITNKFKFFETYKEPTKERKQFRITPPRDDQAKMSSPDREIYRDPDVIRADDRVDDVVHTDTARKMLSIFRQMENQATKEDVPDGPKPLKRFTPPPEDKFAKATASESDEDEIEEGEESEGEESGEERDPNYVRASDKVEDEFLKQSQNAARAKTLRAKFEQWETTDGKATSPHVAEMDMAQGNGDQASIESASSLRARFESLGSQAADAPRAPKVKVNRFVEIQTICMDVCESCEKKVYPLEKVETNNKIFHKQCFRCLQCNCVLRMDTFTLNNGKLYCIPHFKQLFIARGNYDEGFGVDPHKNKWSTNSTNSSSGAVTAPIAVSNGRAASVANRV